MQTLTCSEGHDWTRETTPGRPPKHCPEHATAIEDAYRRRHTTFYKPRTQDTPRRGTPGAGRFIVLD